MKTLLAQTIAEHLRALEMEAPPEIQLDHPRAKEHGDFSSNIAMVLAKGMGLKPIDLAQKLAASLAQDSQLFSRVEVKGPGFLNLFLKTDAYHTALRALWAKPNQIAKPNVGQGRKILVEFVSANPTGPMHVGHGRNAVVGDCLARLLEAVGYAVTREFYINDHGVQIKTLGVSGSHYHSVMTNVGGVQAALPDDVYKGAYLEELVTRLKNEIAAVQGDPIAIGKLLGVELLQTIKEELLRLGIVFDHYFSESSLYESGKIDEALKVLRDQNLAYDQDGALWFKTSEFGDDKDRVLIKGDNTYTYLTPDIAYHKDKFDRKFDLYINVMGADHGGYVQRIKAAVAALGFNPEQLQFLLMQLVNLKRGDEVVNMSKRTGDYVTLHEVIDEVGRDATRFFFMMRSHNATLDFDLELAKQKTSDNPVFYIQYAHARMSSIFAKAAEAGFDAPEKILDVDLASLDLPEEIELIKTIATYHEVLVLAAGEKEPHRVAFYLQDLAKTFQNYYSRGKTDERYRVLSAQKDKTYAKLYLIKTLREVFRAGLEILGVSAPERMERETEEI